MRRSISSHLLVVVPRIIVMHKLKIVAEISGEVLLPDGSSLVCSSRLEDVKTGKLVLFGCFLSLMLFIFIF
jgi:hypothetical protein